MKNLTTIARLGVVIVITFSMVFPLSLTIGHAQVRQQGLTASNNQLWQQEVDGLQGSAESQLFVPTGQGFSWRHRGDEFGRAVISGDFNGDGFRDLAIGSPGEDAEGASIDEGTDYDDLPLGKGAVSVIYGAANGLAANTGPGNQFFMQGQDGLAGQAEIGDGFGSSLAAGDFNGDGKDDLAIGVPGEDYGGAVAVIYGGANGLQTAGNQLWMQGADTIRDKVEFGDKFGAALAAGDFNKDGYFDLAIGAPGENDRAGAVEVIYGSNQGLHGYARLGNQLWDQRECVGCVAPGKLSGGREDDDKLGAALVVGDFNGDTIDDLAIGIPGETNNGDPGPRSGSVAILYGNSALGQTEGLHDWNACGDQHWNQNSPGIEGGCESEDEFGFALAAGDFNRDGIDDLAVGVPGETWCCEYSFSIRAGAINVIYGSRNGLTAAGNQFFDQNDPNIAGGGEDYDAFGKSLAGGDFNDDGYADLAIGVPGEDRANGEVYILQGTGAGLAAANSQFWEQGGAVKGTPEDGDWFGWALAVGDFNGDGGADLAIGTPFEDNTAGAAAVLYGTKGKTPRGDFDGDNKADLAVWRGQTGMWYYNGSVGGVTRSAFWGSGASPYNDVPVPADYDGDSRMDYAVWRPAEGNWYVKCSSGADFPVVNFGGPGDTLVPADYDGDGKDDIAVWRGAAGVWIIRRSSDGVTTQEPWGEQNAPYLDVAAPADYDGDGKADLAVFRRSDGYWHIKHSSDSAYIQTWWGLSTDTPVPGDYDGDGKADIAVWRSSNYAWYAIFSSTGVGTTLPPCGSANAPYYDIPVQADYDGDGKTDQAVWRPGTHSFLIVRSSSFQVLEVPYGQIGDTLVAKHMPNR